MLKSFTSSLVLAGSALVLASFVPACGSAGGPPSGFNNPNNGSADASTGNNNNNNNNGDDGGGHGFQGSPDSGNSNDEDAGCATATATATKQPVAMEFVLDGSGSMGQDNKWTAVTAALTSIFSQMATTNDPGIAAGLIVFSDTNDTTTDGPYPGSNDVPIAQVGTTQAAALEGRYGGGDQPNGDTPTGAAMTGGYSVLTSYVGSGAGLNAKKVLILLTDGVPTDNCAVSGTAYSTDQCVTQAATELTLAAPQGPIETFAIGVGIFPSTNLGNFDPSFLGYIAQAGGSGPAGCNPGDNTSLTGLCYFEVNPSGSSSATQTAFETAINNIRGQVASCVFALDATDAGTIDTSKVNVNVNGSPIFLDPTNGWSYTPGSNDTSITLNGTSCATVKNTPNSTVSIVLGCTSQTPPK